MASLKQARKHLLGCQKALQPQINPLLLCPRPGFSVTQGDVKDCKAMEEAPRHLVCEGEIMGGRFTFKKSSDKHMLGIMFFSHSGGTGSRHLWRFLLILRVCDDSGEINTDMLSHIS